MNTYFFLKDIGNISYYLGGEIKLTESRLISISNHVHYWTNNPHDKKSCSGYYVFLGPNLFGWSFKKQQGMAPSTEAEYKDLVNITCELISWLT